MCRFRYQPAPIRISVQFREKFLPDLSIYLFLFLKWRWRRWRRWRRGTNLVSIGYDEMARIRWNGSIPSTRLRWEERLAHNRQQNWFRLDQCRTIVDAVPLLGLYQLLKNLRHENSIAYWSAADIGTQVLHLTEWGRHLIYIHISIY